MKENLYANLLVISSLGYALVAIVLGLFVVTFLAAGKYTKDTISLNALNSYLTGLDLAMSSKTALDAEAERSELEQLFNDVKASCTEADISSNNDLKEVLKNTCDRIDQTMQTKEIGKRSAWQQLKETAFGFQDMYFKVPV